MNMTEMQRAFQSAKEKSDDARMLNQYAAEMLRMMHLVFNIRRCRRRKIGKLLDVFTVVFERRSPGRRWSGRIRVRVYRGNSILLLQCHVRDCGDCAAELMDLAWTAPLV